MSLTDWLTEITLCHHVGGFWRAPLDGLCVPAYGQRGLCIAGPRDWQRAEDWARRSAWRGGVVRLEMTQDARDFAALDGAQDIIPALAPFLQALAEGPAILCGGDRPGLGIACALLLDAANLPPGAFALLQGPPKGGLFPSLSV